MNSAGESQNRLKIPSRADPNMKIPLKSSNSQDKHQNLISALNKTRQSQVKQTQISRSTPPNTASSEFNSSQHSNLSQIIIGQTTIRPAKHGKKVNFQQIPIVRQPMTSIPSIPNCVNSILMPSPVYQNPPMILSPINPFFINPVTPQYYNVTENCDYDSDFSIGSNCQIIPYINNVQTSTVLQNSHVSDVIQTQTPKVRILSDYRIKESDAMPSLSLNSAMTVSKNCTVKKQSFAKKQNREEQMKARRRLKLDENNTIFMTPKVREAVEYAISSHQSLGYVANECGVSKSTLSRKVRAMGKNDENQQKRKRGGQTTFTEDIENRIQDYIFNMQKLGLSCDVNDVLAYATELAKRLNIKSSLSSAWMTRFLNRHPRISLKTPQILDKRAAEVEVDECKGFMRKVHQITLDKNISEVWGDPTANPPRSPSLFCLDEVNFSVNCKAKKFLGEKGKPMIIAENAKPKQRFTVTYATSANGKMFQTQIILDHTVTIKEMLEIKNLCDGDSWENIRVWQNKSGWQVNETYRDYVHVLIPEFLKEGIPCMLIKDNHSTHNAEAVEQDLDYHGIFNLSLLPHTTSYNQANDWGLHRQAKRLYPLYRKDYLRDKILAWVKEVVKCKKTGIKTYPARPELTIVEAVSIYKRVDDELRQHPNWVTCGWRATGWYPYNPDNIHKEMTFDINELDLDEDDFDIDALIREEEFRMMLQNVKTECFRLNQLSSDDPAIQFELLKMTESVTNIEIIKNYSTQNSSDPSEFTAPNDNSQNNIISDVHIDPSNQNETTNQPTSPTNERFTFLVNPDSEHPNEFTKKTKKGRISHFGFRNRIEIGEVAANAQRAIRNLSTVKEVPRVNPLRPFKTAKISAKSNRQSNVMKSASPIKKKKKLSVLEKIQNLRRLKEKYHESEDQTFETDLKDQSGNSNSCIVSKDLSNGTKLKISEEERRKMEKFVQEQKNATEVEQKRKDELRDLIILNCYDLTDDQLTKILKQSKHRIDAIVSGRAINTQRSKINCSYDPLIISSSEILLEKQLNFFFRLSPWMRDNERIIPEFMIYCFMSRHNMKYKDAIDRIILQEEKKELYRML